VIVLLFYACFIQGYIKRGSSEKKGRYFSNDKRDFIDPPSQLVYTMYPDRAMFQRMVKEEPSLSDPGRETLLALYDGPLHLRQILDIINTSDNAETDKGAKDQNISESTLRKRLDVLITRGIIARAGSERTNPYYYIRRPWIFNQYILAKCRDGPSSGLLDLTILLHQLSRMGAEGDANLPHPRYLSAAGDRTERGHQIQTAYGAFQKILGNKTAISDYLEGIYEDIYEGKVPESDVDGLIARDFLRFVATAPNENGRSGSSCGMRTFSISSTGTRKPTMHSCRG
jgi:hypothetical protein